MTKKVLSFLILFILFSPLSPQARAEEVTPYQKMRLSLDESLRMADSLEKETQRTLEQCDAILDEIARVRIQARRKNHK